MARRSVQLLAASQFSNGLRLDTDAFQLGDGASPDLLNVDCDTRGGVALRKACVPLNESAAPFTSPIHSMFFYATVAGTEQILVGSGKHTYYGTGGNFTSTGITWTSANRQRACTFRDLLYVQNGVDAPKRWNGSTATNLTQTINDNIQSPNDGDMPIAKCIAAWQGYVWVANTVGAAGFTGESAGVQYGSRVRWSHPNRGEDWRDDDYVDVNTGQDGDQITALVPLADRLLVFKNRSVHAITGFDPDSFQVTFVANVGAPSQEAVVPTEYGVYFFSWPRGVHLISDRGMYYEFDALYPAILNGDIPDAYQAKIAGGYLDRRIWFSVPWQSSTENARTFVLTPGKQGGWVQYDLGFSAIAEWIRRSSEHFMLAATSGHTDAVRVMKVREDADADTWYSDYVTLTGASTSYVSAPDDADLSITGDLDVSVCLAATDWTPASTQVLFSKSSATGNQRSWRFYLTTSGNLGYVWSTSGTSGTETVKASSVTLGSVGITDGTKVWLRVFHDVNNGAAGNDVKFYYSYDGAAWTQLGSTQTTAGTTSIYDSTASVVVGAWDDSERFAGKVFYADVYSGDRTAGGTVKGVMDATLHAAGTTSWTASTGEVWTLAAAAALSTIDTTIESYYQTRWFDAGSPAVIKRWRRPDIVLDAEVDTTLRVGVYRNYDPTFEQRAFTLTVNGSDGGLTWGVDSWGTEAWGSEASGAQTIERGSGLGRGRSVSLRFAGPTPSTRWSVNSISLKYIPRRVR